jgi:hypothetical protein
LSRFGLLAARSITHGSTRRFRLGFVWSALLAFSDLERRRNVPKGPRGEKRPGDVIGAAIMVAKIATGEIEEAKEDMAAKKSKAGKKGAAARAKTLTPQERSEIASLAASARWKKS